MKDDVGDSVGYRIDATGRATELDWWGEGGSVEGALTWIHLDLTTPAARHWLEERSALDAIAIEALLEDETRPRSVPIGAGLLVILRGVNLNPGADPEDMVALRIWAEEGRVITARRRVLMAVRDERAAVVRGEGPRSAGDFLVEIASRLVERMAGVLGALNESVDAIEEALVETAIHEQRRQLTAIRREAIALRRYLAPQRDALARLHNERVPWLSDTHRLMLREVTDTTMRYVEDLEAARERTAVTQEELNGRLAEQMNNRMYALSVIASVFLPLGFLTGLLGINVGGIPGSDSSIGFGVVCLGLVGLGAAQLFLFRRLRWL